MNFDAIGGGGVWLILAIVLGIAELLVPGVFLVFLAIAAAVTGVAALALPDLTLPLQLGMFAVWSAITIFIGKRWYRDFPVESGDPKLNDRAARMIGQSARVTDAIEGGKGRVRVGDGEWPASGPDQPAGALVTIVAVEGGVVRIEPGFTTG